MRINARAKNTEVTHGGAPAHSMNDVQALRRSVLSCLLFEKEFYESGEEIAARIERLAMKVDPQIVADLAYEVRTKGNLRHAPLPLLYALTQTGAGVPGLVSGAIGRTLQRADEMPEFLAYYWSHLKDGKKRPLSAGAKKGIAQAMAKFNEYGLAKYDRDNAFKLRDVLRISHPVPENEEKSALYKRVIERTLETPDTWEVALSGGADKRETFTRLLTEKKLGYLALLRNLRNMMQADVDQNLVEQAILARKGGAERVLPFRFVAAARACPQLERALDIAMSASIDALPRLIGDTVVLVDVSGSMDRKLSLKSDLNRIDAAAALASVINAERLRVFSFSNQLVEVPARRGMAGIDAITRSQGHGGTYLFKAVADVQRLVPKHDRIILITDEQATAQQQGLYSQFYKSRGIDVPTTMPDPVAKDAYVINVASARNGIGYGRWLHVDGFSENTLRWIHEREQFEKDDA